MMKKVKASVSSSALTQCTTPLREEPPLEVRYTPEVWQTISYIVDKQPLEVGWLGLVEETDYGYLITDVFVPKQTVSAAETDIDEDAMAELAIALDDEGKDIGQLLYWGHSHVNMAVSPSAQDEDQVTAFLENCPVFIRGIYNKRGESKVDVYDVARNVIHQCVPDLIDYPALPDERIAALDVVLKTNVEKRVYKPHTQPGKPGAHNWSYKDYHRQQQLAYQRLSPLASDVPSWDSYDADEDDLDGYDYYQKAMSDPFYAGGYN